MTAQDGFRQGILDGQASVGLRAVSGQVSLERGLEAYRNNLKVLSAQALGASFPQLREALGDAEFRAMAWAYWRADPPRRGDLACWGEGLAAYLIEQAGEASGLPALARQDWALHQAERAPDAPLDAPSLALLGSLEASAIGLRLRPGLQLVDEHLVWRAAWKGCTRKLAASEAAFVAAVLDGQSLQAALDAAALKGLGDSSDFSFTHWLQESLQQEWLHGVVPLSEAPFEKAPE